MELRHLRYFVAVAERQNVSRAANELHVSQPALSRQIKDLESELGFDLLQRTAKSVSLTKSGKVFLQQAKAVLRKVEEAVSKAREAHVAHTAVLHVGYAPSPTAGFLPELLRSFQTNAGNKVILHDMTSEEMLKGLANGKLQIALMVEQPCNLPPAVTFEPLVSYETGIILARNHPWSRKKFVTVGEILPHPLISYSKAEYHDYHSWLRKWLGLPARKLKIVEECDGVLSLIAAVEAERGVAVVSKGVMHLAGSRVLFLPLHPAPAPIQVGICYCTADVQQPQVKLFLEVAKNLTNRGMKSKS